MKILFLFCLVVNFAYNQIPIDTTIKKNIVGEEQTNTEVEIVEFADEMPYFPGGDDELMNFLSKNLKYPELAKRAGITGKVIIDFVIEIDGKISDIKVVKGIGYGCDDEAVRVVKLMPKWIPAKINGKPIRFKLTLPIVFK